MADLKIQGVVEVSTEGAESSLGRVGNAADKMAVNMAAAGAKAGKAVDQIGEIAKATGEKFTRAESVITGSLKKLAVEAAKAKSVTEGLGNIEFNIAAKGLDPAKFQPMINVVRQLAAEYSHLETAQARTSGSSGQLAGRLQNSSYQLQDFIVQVNGGVDATKALGQQLPQLLVGFGAAGAAIGVVAALLPNIIAAFSNSAEGAKKFSDALSDFDKAVGDVGSTVKSFDMEKLYEEFNNSSSAVRAATIEQIKFQQEYIKTTQLVAGKKFGESLGGMGEYSTLDKLAGSYGSSGAEKLAKQLGVTVEVAKDLLPVLGGLKSGSEDVGLAFSKFGTTLLGGNAKAVELAQTMATLSKSERDGAAASSALSEAQAKMAKGHIVTKKEAEAAAKATKASSKATEEFANLLDKINGKESGLNAEYWNELERLNAAYKSGKIPLDAYSDLVDKLTKQQPFYVRGLKEEAEALKDITDLERERAKYALDISKQTQDLIEKADAAEYENSKIGATEQQLIALTAARYDEQIALKEEKIAAIEMMEGRNAEVEAIEQQISALRRLQSAEIAKPKLREQAREWEKFSDDIERSLTDALMRSFESGESFGDAFIKNLKNTFKTAALKLVIQTVVGGAGSSLGLTGGSSSGNALSSLFGLGGTGTGGSSDNMIGSLATSAVKAAATYFGDSIATGLGTGTSLSGQSLVAAQGAYKDAGSFVVDGLSYNGPEIANNLGAGSEFASGALATIGGALSAYTFGAKYGEKYGTAGGTLVGVGAAAGTTAIGGAAAGALGMSAAGAAAGGGVAGATAGASAALAAIPVWGWAALAVAALAGAMGGAKGGPKVRIGTSFDANEFGTIANSEVRRGGTKYGGGQGYDQYIYDGVVRGLVSEIAPDTNIRARLSSVLDPQGDSKNQNQSYVMENGETIYSKRSESGRGQGDWDKFATIEISRMRLAIVTEAMKDAGGNYKAIADLLISPVHDLSAVLGSMSAETMNNAVIGLSNMLFAVDQFEMALGQDIDLSEAIATANATIKTTTDAQGKAVTETTIAALGRVMNETAAVAGVFDQLGLSITESFPADKIFSLSDSLVQMFGGIDNLANSFNAYYANFYSAEEQRAQAMEDMGKAFTSLNLAMPTTREEFRAMVDGLDLATVGGQATFKSLMDLQGGFANLVPAIDSSATSVEALAAAAKELADWKTNTLSQFAPAKTAAQAAQEVNSAGLYGDPGALMTNMDLAGFNAAIVEVVTGANDATRLLFEGQADNLTIIQEYLTGIGEAAEQAAADVAALTKSLQDEGVNLGVELLRAQGNEQGALAAERTIAIAGYTAEQIALYDTNAATRARITTLNEEAEAEKARIAERTTLQDEYDNLTMTSAELLNKQRNALDESNWGLFDNIQAIKTAKTAMADLAQQIEAIGNVRTNIGDARQNVVSQMADFDGPSYYAAQKAILQAQMTSAPDTTSKLGYATKLQTAITNGLQAQINALDKTRDVRLKALQDEANIAEENASKAKQAADNMASALGNIADYANGLKVGNLSTLSPEAKLQAAGSEYQRLLGLAKGGDATAAGNLTGASDSYLGLAKDYYASTAAYSSIFASVEQSLGALGSQKSVYEQIAESAKSTFDLAAQTAASDATYQADLIALQQSAISQFTALDASLGAYQASVEPRLDTQVIELQRLNVSSDVIGDKITESQTAVTASLNRVQATNQQQAAILAQVVALLQQANLIAAQTAAATKTTASAGALAGAA